nr:immunoglobulin light chain junction region [Macaca mulatta]
CMQPLGIPWTF